MENLEMVALNVTKVNCYYC